MNPTVRTLLPRASLAALWLASLLLPAFASAAGPSSHGLPSDLPPSVSPRQLPADAPRLGALALEWEAADAARGKSPKGAPRCLPFQEGERLEYVLEWMGIDVGRAFFEVLPDGRFGRRDAWHFRMTARTTSWADRIYRVRDKLDGWANPRMDRAIGHEKIAREGSYHRDIKLDLDWRKRRVTYRNQWKAFPPKPLFADTWDPLGLLYAFRMRTIDAKGHHPMSVTDGLKTIRADVKVHGVETIEVGGRKIEAWHVEPEMKDVGGVFERSPGARMHVWVSRDGRHLPLRLQSKVMVGSFTATLVKATGLAPDRAGCRLDTLR
ncbi:MAG: hypothetical protein RIT45_2217 [Pseudomonadota bacterium]